MLLLQHVVLTSESFSLSYVICQAMLHWHCGVFNLVEVCLIVRLSVFVPDGWVSLHTAQVLTSKGTIMHTHVFNTTVSLRVKTCAV